MRSHFPVAARRRLHLTEWTTTDFYVERAYFRTSSNDGMADQGIVEQSATIRRPAWDRLRCRLRSL